MSRPLNCRGVRFIRPTVEDLRKSAEQPQVEINSYSVVDGDGRMIYERVTASGSLTLRQLKN